jgi:predicted heme/steroid binding protein
VAYEGRIYDVSLSPEWRDGLHRNLHWAGQDLTAYLVEAPHGEENLSRYPVVGRLLLD